MSCKLFAAESSEAPQPMTMQWSTAASQAPRAQSQTPFANAPKPAEGNNAEELKELKVKLAAAEQRVREAREAGRAEGDAQGRRSVQAEVDSALQKLSSAIREASELRSRLRSQAEADLVRLAIAIARRIVGRELSADPEAIIALVKFALEKMRVQEVLRVRVNSAHRARISDFLTRFGASHIEVVADPGAEIGAAIFETSRGNFDSSAETQLAEIDRGLTDRFRGQ